MNHNARRLGLQKVYSKRDFGRGKKGLGILTKTPRGFGQTPSSTSLEANCVSLHIEPNHEDGQSMKDFGKMDNTMRANLLEMKMTL